MKPTTNIRTISKAWYASSIILGFTAVRHRISRTISNLNVNFVGARTRIFVILFRQFSAGSKAKLKARELAVMFM